MARLKVGIIGTGGIAGKGGGQGTHGYGFTTCEKTQIVAAADLVPANLERFAQHWNVPREHCYPDHRKLLESEKLDIVSVATHNLHHAQPVIDAARAGVKVIVVEKPIATSAAEADEMIGACREARAHLIVEHTRRFHRGYLALRQMALAGDLGKVSVITSHGCRPLLHNGTHSVDLAFMMTHQRPLRACGFLSDEPVADPGGYGLIACEGGLVIAVNCVPDRRDFYSSLEVHGNQGRATSNEFFQDWHLYRLEPTPGRGYGATFTEKPWDVNRSYDLGEWFCWMAEEAADCFLEDREGVSTGEEGLKTLEAIVAMQISHKLSTWVDLPLKEGLRDYRVRSTGQ
ncbi:MAG: Gfo/Idh/MocA family oxidoreductase [Planctomycetes bacterium]|nr:Gfo/Idh/MocA family oxidoreductase [Planctomycetota bacterium]